jgi:hypothetical protein|tara:strand:+ start:125 stop:406 length:282 start_codon:yes stop_codon:yes gene_type:complete
MNNFSIKIQAVNKIGDVLQTLETQALTANTQATAERQLLLDTNIKALYLNNVQKLNVSHRDSRNYDGTLISRTLSAPGEDDVRFTLVPPSTAC